ncbi:hypothetical protein FB567DRAFT_531735 [Paraphoma chrysanthemicola]|uniref:BZIP domain-containing protein n=1 Tax=Paraphoma chrysanthemicola TaxID=798071 RepID=A0A8K0R2G6_9PLEO|nr:hypothetical protein FB567DRAFT_531735 [Paraphoma chrysanthemicola]
MDRNMTRKRQRTESASSKTQRSSDAGNNIAVTEQRARKRAIDRMAQRTLRDKTKRYIAYLERTLEECKTNSGSETVKKLLDHNANLFAQTEAFRKMLTDISSVINPELMPQILQKPPERMVASQIPQCSLEPPQPYSLQQACRPNTERSDAVLSAPSKSRVGGDAAADVHTYSSNGIYSNGQIPLSDSFGEDDLLLPPSPQDHDMRELDEMHRKGVLGDVEQYAPSSGSDDSLDVEHSNIFLAQNGSIGTTQHDHFSSKDYDTSYAHAYDGDISLDGIALPRQWVSKIMARLPDA